MVPRTRLLALAGQRVRAGLGRLGELDGRARRGRRRRGGGLHQNLLGGDEHRRTSAGHTAPFCR